MKKNNIPGNATPAPAKKAENKRDLRKIAEARSRARRMRSMMKLGMKPELIEEMFAQEDNRMILVLLNGQYTIQDGTKIKKIYNRDKHHKVISVKEEEIPNMLHGCAAACKYATDQKLHILSSGSNAIWILSDKDHVEDAVEKLKALGRVSITKPEVKPSKNNKTSKKPTNNTAETKNAAKVAKKKVNNKKVNMRPYYAALRKGGVKARIKKYNPSLAEKIEIWLKERKKAKAEKADRIDKHKRDHRQMSSIEMKRNKKACKAVKHLATQERRKKAEEERARINISNRAKRAKKPIQTELKAAA